MEAVTANTDLSHFDCEYVFRATDKIFRKRIWNFDLNDCSGIGVICSSFGWHWGKFASRSGFVERTAAALHNKEPGA